VAAFSPRQRPFTFTTRTTRNPARPQKIGVGARVGARVVAMPAGMPFTLPELSER